MGFTPMHPFITAPVQECFVPVVKLNAPYFPFPKAGRSNVQEFNQLTFPGMYHFVTHVCLFIGYSDKPFRLFNLDQCTQLPHVSLGEKLHRGLFNYPMATGLVF
jgi:hypothetical protein